MAKTAPESFDPPADAKAAPKKVAAEAATPAHTTYPGQTLGIVALVFSFVTAVPALAMGIIAWVWSHKAGHNNVVAKVAVGVSAFFTIIGVFFFGIWVAMATAFLGGDFPGDRVVRLQPGDGMVFGGELHDQLHMDGMLPFPGEMPMDQMPLDDTTQTN